jgi:non-specific serine/threonine protein kinase
MIEECAALAETLLRGAPFVRIVATSREALSVPGETVWRVPSLGLPPANELDPAHLLTFDAVRLFFERADSVGHVASSDNEIQAVGDICRRLDGVALAIELAAARVKVLSVEQIRDRLHDRFRLLTGGRTVIARQRTLEAAVDWSYDLLTDPERRLLARLSVFSGGCELQAAEQVCSDSDIEERDVLDLLSRLLDKSLVAFDESPGVQRRYRLLETIRQYGRDRLLRSGEASTVSDRHFAYFLGLARRAGPELIRADQVKWLERLEHDHDNFRIAIDWGTTEPSRRAAALELAQCVAWFWIKRGYFREGRQRLERILAASPDVPRRLEVRALMSLAHLASFEGDLEMTRAATAKSLATARACGDDLTESFALGYDAITESDAGNFNASAELAAAAREIAARCTDPAASQPLSLALRMVGYGAMQRSDLPEAARLFPEAIAEERKAGDVWALGILLSDLAALRVLEQRHEEAASLAREALAFCRALADRRGMGWCLQTIAMLEAAADRPREAAMIYGAAEALFESVGATCQTTVTRVQDRYLSRARQAIGEIVFGDAAATGRALPVEDVLDMANRSQS